MLGPPRLVHVGARLDEQVVRVQRTIIADEEEVHGVPELRRARGGLEVAPLWMSEGSPRARLNVVLDEVAPSIQEINGPFRPGIDRHSFELCECEIRLTTRFPFLLRHVVRVQRTNITNSKEQVGVALSIDEQHQMHVNRWMERGPLGIVLAEVDLHGLARRGEHVQCVVIQRRRDDGAPKLHVGDLSDIHPPPEPHRVVWDVLAVDAALHSTVVRQIETPLE
mmetsp:Transcript_2260/g.4353  ORF Transcript_2260/g.4353 Transcript_2260/m.4353 type:complete len:223 (-) Transcript_2260:624-1292(-)